MFEKGRHQTSRVTFIRKRQPNEVELNGNQEEFEIFVERFMHFLNFWAVYRDLLSERYVPSLSSAENDPFPRMNDTLMFVLYSLFYSLIENDHQGVNAFRVWRAKFPEEENAIRAIELEIEPFADRLRVFRNRLGFHGSRSRMHEASGFDLFAKHSGDELWNAMRRFKQLGALLLDKDLNRARTHG